MIITDERDRIFQALKREYIEGQCNCIYCRTARYTERFWDIYQHKAHLPFIPHNINPRFGFNGGSREFSWKNRWRQFEGTLEILDAAWTWNKHRVPNYRRHNTSYFYCTDCGTAHRTSEGGRVKYLSNIPAPPRPPLRREGDFNRSSGQVIGEGYVCDDCLKRYTLCPECGWYYIKNAMRSLTFDHEQHRRRGVIVCLPCFEATYAYCYKCAIAVVQSDPSTTTFWTHSDLDYQPSEIRYLCSRCEEQERAHCVHCNKIIYKIDSQCTDDKYWCAQCYNWIIPFHDYAYKPEAKLRKPATNPNIRDDTLIFGVELEVEDRGMEVITPMAAMAHRIMITRGREDMYIKTDNSLNNGIEIVTHPFTWQQFKEDKPKWAELFCLLKDYQYGPSNRCGIHVHMSKKAFTTLHLYKFIRFFYAKPNREFIYAMSQRPDREWFDEYCKFYARDENHLCTNAKNKKNESGERHSAVSLYQSTTVEVRIFQSTIQLEGFFKIIEFLKSTYDFSKDNKINDMLVYKYALHVKRNQNMYTNLYKFLSTNEHIHNEYSVLNNIIQKGV